MKEKSISKVIVKNLNPKILPSRPSSPTRLSTTGAAIFPIQYMNHQKAILGMISNIPLLIIILREPLRSYTTPNKKNKPEEHNP